MPKWPSDFIQRIGIIISALRRRQVIGERFSLAISIRDRHELARGIVGFLSIIGVGINPVAARCHQ